VEATTPAIDEVTTVVSTSTSKVATTEGNLIICTVIQAAGLQIKL